jgi:phosphatidylglycerophosphatase GEP4
VIVGDRIFTDVVMANRMRGSGCGPLAVWTTGVWQRESMMVRWLEKRVVDMVTRWTGRESTFQDAFAAASQPNETVLSRVLNTVRRK